MILPGKIENDNDSISEESAIDGGFFLS